MLNVAIIGLGGIGNTHAGVYKANSKANLAAVCDMDKARADKAAAQYGVPAFYSVADLVKNVALDAVSVTTAG
ncbi:MAG TPA: Gfo/Idh/MocA family oxidoreductase, partial [Caldilineaceae bacterium]|nr:Gfo/Idh/MocA family oxidoreductase [Caldilineaceae bacterium]